MKPKIYELKPFIDQEQYVFELKIWMVSHYRCLGQQNRKNGQVLGNCGVAAHFWGLGVVSFNCWEMLILALNELVYHISHVVMSKSLEMAKYVYKKC